MNFSQINLKGKTAIVTGGSKGIGYGMALGLATVGANIIIVSRNIEEGRAAAKDCEAKGVKAHAISCDVTNSAAVTAMAEEAAKTFGQVDILINNAGMNIRKPLVDVLDSDWDTVINTNLKGVFLVGREVAKQMIKQGKGGSIVNVASIGGVVGIPNLNSYCASKGGVVQMTKVWALELAEHKITVNAVCPAYIKTPMTAGWLNDEERLNWILNMTPMGRLGEIEEVAGPIVFLSSDWASYITGAIITVDGGWTAR